MQEPNAIENALSAALKGFARSINNSGADVVGDLSSIVEITNRLALLNLSHWERLIRDEFSSALDNTAPQKWMLWRKPSRFLTWLDLVSSDGYMREKALRSISGPAPNAFFFSLAIRRLNDWVPQVREAAAEKLPLMAKETGPEHVVDALCHALSNWNSWGRIQRADRQVLLEIISNKELLKPLKSRLIYSASGPMATLLTQIGRTSLLDAHLSEIAEQAIQPAVRAKAYRSQFEGKMIWTEGRKWEWIDVRYCKGGWKPIFFERELEVAPPSSIDLLEKSAVDRSTFVRRVAAEFLIRDAETLGDQAMRFAKLFAADSSRPVAERGQFVLKMLGI